MRWRRRRTIQVEIHLRAQIISDNSPGRSTGWKWVRHDFGSSAGCKQINTSGSHIAKRILTTHIQPSFHATWIFDGQDTTVAAAPHHSRKSGQVIQGKMMWWYSTAIPDSWTTWFWFFGALFGVLLWYHFTTHAHPLRWQGMNHRDGVLTAGRWKSIFFANKLEFHVPSYFGFFFG